MCGFCEPTFQEFLSRFTRKSGEPVPGMFLSSAPVRRTGAVEIIVSREERDREVAYPCAFSNSLHADFPRCRTYPGGGLDELYLCCDWYFLCDDHVDEGAYRRQSASMQAMHEYLLALLSNSPLVLPRGAAAQALSDMYQRLRRRISSRWGQRFVRHRVGYIAGQRQDAIFSRSQSLPGPHIYIKHRCAASAGLNCCV